MAEIERPPKVRPPVRRKSGLKPPKGDIDDIETHAELYKVSYQEGQRALDDQRDELKGARDRAVSFTSFVGAATAFLVGTGLLHVSQKDTLFFTLASIASASSAIYIVLLWTVLKPWKSKQWYYRMRPNALIEGFIEETEVPPPGPGHFYRALAERYDYMRSQNEELLRSLRKWYNLLIVVGAIQVVAWATLVWARG
jgi:hypothetical protein